MKRIFKNILAVPFLAIGVVFGSVAFVCAFLAAWFTEYNNIVTRFKNLDTETVEYRSVVIPTLAKDLQISEQEFVTYLRDEWDMYIQEVNEATC